MKEIDNRLRAVETAVAQKPDDDRLRTLESKMDTRLTSVERAVSTAQETRRTPVPWYTVAAGIASILGIVATVFLLLNLKLLVG